MHGMHRTQQLELIRVSAAEAVSGFFFFVRDHPRAMTKKHVADLLLSISTRAVARQTWAAYSRSPGRRSIPALDAAWACGRPKGGIVGAGNPCSDLPWLAALALFGPVQRLTAQSDWAQNQERHLMTCAWWCGCTLDSTLPSPGMLGTAGCECWTVEGAAVRTSTGTFPLPSVAQSGGIVSQDGRGSPHATSTYVHTYIHMYSPYPL